MKIIATLLVLVVAPVIFGQQSSAINERRVSLTEPAVALDSNGTSVLEARLLTTGINGAQDTPVTNVRFVVRNSSSLSYAFVSGVVTFYDAAGIRCGEGLFKADSLATDESFETDSPGLRIRCAPSTWRVVATNLVPRMLMPSVQPVSRLEISVDGEAHPLQLDKPLKLNVGDKQRTIVVRSAP
jgi:hypothetical protein